MADVPTTLTGLSALLVAVLGAAGPAAASHSVTAPSALFAPVGRPTVIAGSSVAGFGEGPLRIVVTVTSGVVGFPAAAAAVTVPAGYPELGATGPEIAIEGDESAVNAALAGLSWTPQTPGPAEVTVDAGPAGAAYEPGGAHFYQLVTSPVPITWSAARDAAVAMTFHGLTGSLATISSDAERALLHVIASTDAWVGAVELVPPDDVRWLAAPDATASISSFVVEYTPPLEPGGPEVGRAVAGLNAALPPAAPVISAVTGGTEEATVVWQAPATDGGAPVLGYVVSGDPVGWCTATSALTSCVLRGLVGGAAHTFRVAAINQVGLGPWSGPSAPVTPAAHVVPEVPAKPDERVYVPVDTVVQPLPNDAPAVETPDGTIAPPAAGPTASAGETAVPAAGDRTGSPATSAEESTNPVNTGTAAAPTTATTTVATAAGSATAEVATGADGASAPTVPSAADASTAEVGDAAGAAAATANAGPPDVVVVFNVGPGTPLEDARFTVRGKHLSPGTVVTATAYSEPMVVGTVGVEADGTVAWIGQLPVGLPDGDHRLVAEGVGHDGSKVERTMSLTVESGRLVRIGASSLETIAPAVPATVPVPDPAADVAAATPADRSGGGGLPRKALALVVLLGGVAFLLWRAQSRRTAGQGGEVVGAPAAGTAGTRAAQTGASANAGRTARSRRHGSGGARRRSRRQPARSL